MILGYSFTMLGQGVDSEIALRKRGGLTIFPQDKKLSDIAINASPNPATDIVKITASKSLKGFALSIFDQSGRRVMQIEQWKGETLDVSRLKDGLYIIRITKRQESYAQKFLVQRAVK